MLERIGGIPSWARWGMLVAGCAIFYFLWLMPVPLTEVDEARFTEASREMIESGDWIIPHFNYEPRYRKPVLFYWVQAGAFKLLGQSEAAARVPSGMASTVLVLMLYGFLASGLWVGDQGKQRAHGAAFLGALGLMLSPLVVIWSRSAVTDPMLTLWITASLLCILQADITLSEGRYTARWYVLAGAFSGLAFLTKGPIGLAIPGMVWALYHLLQRDLGKAAKSVPWVRTLGVFILIAVPWYVATYIVDGPAFLKWFFLRENVERYTTTMQGHGVGNPIVALLGYLGIALVTLFPMSPFLLQETISPFGGDSAHVDDRLRRMRRFGLVWFAVVVGIFSVSKTQLPAYIQSIAGAAGLLFAIHVYTRARVKRVWKSVLETSLLVSVGIVWTCLPFYVLPKGFVQGGIIGTEMFPRVAATVLMYLCGAAGLLLIGGGIFYRIRRDDVRLIRWMLIVWGVLLGGIILGIMPLVIRSIFQPTKDLGLYLASLPRGNRVAAYCKGRPESLVYYSERKIEFWERDKPDTLKLVKEAFPGGCIFVVDSDGLESLRKLGDIEIIRVFGKISVVRAKGSFPRGN